MVEYFKLVRDGHSDRLCADAVFKRSRLKSCCGVEAVLDKQPVSRCEAGCSNYLLYS